MVESLSIAEAAQVLGVSTDTIRRRIKRGQIEAVQVPTQHGPAWRVCSSSLRTVGTVPGQDVPTVSSTPTQPGVEQLVALVAKLQEENRVMAGRIGWLEAQLDHARALPAPQTSPDAQEGTASRSAAETPVAPSDSTQARPGFWTRLRAALHG